MFLGPLKKVIPSTQNFVVVILSFISWADPGIFERGGGVPARYNFWGLEIDLLPLHTYPYVFVVRVEKHCWLITIKFIRSQNPIKISNGGGGGGGGPPSPRGGRGAAGGGGGGGGGETPPEAHEN